MKRMLGGEVGWRGGEFAPETEREEVDVARDACVVSVPCVGAPREEADVFAWLKGGGTVVADGGGGGTVVEKEDSPDECCDCWRLSRTCAAGGRGLYVRGGGVGNEVADDEEMVVVRPASALVSADGGGGSEASTEARQRKHSPLPKYFGFGCGYSDM